MLQAVEGLGGTETESWRRNSKELGPDLIHVSVFAQEHTLKFVQLI